MTDSHVDETRIIGNAYRVDPDHGFAVYMEARAIRGGVVVSANFRSPSALLEAIESCELFALAETLDLVTVRLLRCVDPCWPEAAELRALIDDTLSCALADCRQGIGGAS
jgi:hypothetical protein